jgi:hypothetical protein
MPGLSQLLCPVDTVADGLTCKSGSVMQRLCEGFSFWSVTVKEYADALRCGVQLPSKLADDSCQEKKNSERGKSLCLESNRLKVSTCLNSLFFCFPEHASSGILRTCDISINEQRTSSRINIVMKTEQSTLYCSKKTNLFIEKALSALCWKTLFESRKHLNCWKKYYHSGFSPDLQTKRQLSAFTALHIKLKCI